jgi:hypothetical protein
MVHRFLRRRATWGVLGVTLAVPAVALATGPGGGSQSGCHVLGVPSASASRVIDGHWLDARRSGRETTEFFAGGSYRVTRCGEDGRFVRSQTVAPVPIPSGGSALLPISEVRPTGLPQPDGRQLLVERSGIYPDPQDPRWARIWRADRQEILARVLPPTRHDS